MIFRSERQYIYAIEPDQAESWARAIDRNLELWIANLERTGVAEVGDRPAGYAMWTDDGRESTLITINVAVEHRRSGIGGQLMQRFVDDARDHGVATLKLGVHEDNPVRGLYEGGGFVRTGRDGNYLLYELDLLDPAESGM